MSLFIEGSPYVFLCITIILGGGAAFLAGRSLARGWKSPILLFFYMLIFTAGIRFLHFALFQAQLTSLHYYLSHGLVVMIFAFVGYRTTLAKQMTEKYPWLYERTSPLSWRQKA
ncbi:DUF6867 family protein [Aestuariivirga litoralis]|uniref:DUF6867 family protein n=1 Tax=Aestuariivirga litoralis TaxID=2650924 RepID=UPI0018C4E9C7|nr:hypothetical protein [Aestuariivirga litoralis]MBG1231946.1 hypothetical protein [Aestuariivirga litoralis]